MTLNNDKLYELQKHLECFSKKIKWVTGSITLASLISCSYQESPAPLNRLIGDLSRPNILLLVAEDMSHRVGAFGDSVAYTPNLDDLAEESVLYPNAFTTAGVCAPSRAGLITGMYQNSFGASGMRTSTYPEGGYTTVPPEEVKAFPELLRSDGYYTFTNDKLDYQFSGSRAGSGPFTIWDDEKAFDNLWTPIDDGSPFFGMINFQVTHESMLFPRKGIPKGLIPAIFRFMYREYHRNMIEHIFPEDVEIPPYYPDTPVVRQQLAQHYNNIAYMDRQVGEILDRLENDKLKDNTIIIWTTDHGDCLPRSKRELYDSGTKVPILIRWPEKYQPADAYPGEVDQRLISFVDLGPTILKLAGVEIPDNMHGQVVLGKDAEPRNLIYGAKDRIDEHHDMQRTVRDERFRYIQNGKSGVAGAYHIKYRDNLEIMQELWRIEAEGLLEGSQKNWFEPRPMEELYDTVNDPHEIQNLADDPDYADELDRLREELETWQNKIGDLTAEVSEEELKKRFWPEGKQPETAVPDFNVIAVDDGFEIEIIESSPGSSIGFQIVGEDSKEEWRLYTSQFIVEKGTRIKAKAVRYGWKESETILFTAKTYDTNTP